MRIGKTLHPKGIARPVYERAIFKTLRDFGGKMSTDAVYKSVERILSDELQRYPEERESYPSPGEMRWKTQVRQAARSLRAKGEIEKSWDRGVWQIAPAGEERMRKYEATGIDPGDPRDFDMDAMEPV